MIKQVNKLPENNLAWTDYPIVEMGDVAGKIAPIRQCTLLTFDSDKYCNVVIDEQYFESIKRAYIYSQPGRCGEVPGFTIEALSSLPLTQY